MHADFCVDALNEAIEKHGAPEIFDTDRGGKFTSEDLTCISHRFPAAAPSNLSGILKWRSDPPSI